MRVCAGKKAKGVAVFAFFSSSTSSSLSVRECIVRHMVMCVCDQQVYCRSALTGGGATADNRYPKRPQHVCYYYVYADGTTRVDRYLTVVPLCPRESVPCT